jgi:homopolymeric O-antigen transport system ATP-binding protein
MSSNHPVIRVNDLGKCYEIYDRPQDRLKQSIHPRLQRFVGRAPKKYYREFWALKEVSFDVNRGEAVGIIGRNGAGKSTLLQLICGTLNPTCGFVEVQGIVAALLELGSGFNPEFTGRENVYLSASMLGLGHEEIEGRFDEIAAFADIGNFLEQPVKIYSSGMLMRLAFAVNTCINPEILIVDEALSVGDAPFQSKCFKRLRQLIDDGTSVLFVSHDISTVRSICSRALWLKNGHAEMWGDAKDVAKQYERFCWQEEGVVLQYSGSSSESKAVKQSTVENGAEIGIDSEFSIPPQLFEPNPVFEKNRERSRIGTEDVVIRNLIVLNEAGLEATSCDYNEQLTLYYLLEVCKAVSSDFILGIRWRDLKGNFIYSANDINCIHRVEAVPGDRLVASTNLRMPLTSQEYVLLTGVFGFKDGMAFTAGVYDYSRSVIWDVIEDAFYLRVHPCKAMPLPGPVNASFHLRLKKIKLTCGNNHFN